MKINPAYEKEIVSIILYTSIFFIILALVLILFFYYSRKKIIQKELEKKDLEIQHQKDQLEPGANQFFHRFSDGSFGKCSAV